MSIISALPSSSTTSFNTDNWHQSKGALSSDVNNISLGSEARPLLSMEGFLDFLKKTNSATCKATEQSPVFLNIPDDCSKNMSPEVKAALIGIINHQQKGHEIDLSEKLVDAIATLFGSQANSGAPLIRSNDNLTSDLADTSVPSAVSPRTRTFPALENGTDIVTPNASEFKFVNVMGDAKLINALIAILSVFNKQEALANTMSAKWSQNIMAAAALAGDKGIEAATEQRTGAILGGVTNVAIHTGSTIYACKHLGNEAKSSATNMSEANRIKRQLNSGEKISEPDVLHELKDHLTEKHDLVAKNTSAAMQYSALYSQTGLITEKITESSFGVTAAEKKKEAELSSADKTISSEVSSTHSQMAKKANEGESSLRQSMLAVLSSNNEAVSAIASRMG